VYPVPHPVESEQLAPEHVGPESEHVGVVGCVGSCQQRTSPHELSELGRQRLVTLARGLGHGLPSASLGADSLRYVGRICVQVVELNLPPLGVGQRSLNPQLQLSVDIPTV
jgi:hypothetical protein